MSFHLSSMMVNIYFDPHIFLQGEYEKKINRKYEQGDRNKENDLETATLNGISNLSLK